MGHRKPGRPAKHVGLFTPADLKKVADGNSLRGLREDEPVEEGSVLPDSRSPEAPRNGEGRIFGTAQSGDIERSADRVQPPLSDSPGRLDSFDVKFTELLRKIAVEQAEGEEPGVSKLEKFARMAFDAALSQNLGSQKAREFIIDRLEGKAGRAAPVTGTNTELDDQLDKAAVDLLNSLTAKTDKGASDV